MAEAVADRMKINQSETSCPLASLRFGGSRLNHEWFMRDQSTERSASIRPIRSWRKFINRN